MTTSCPSHEELVSAVMAHVGPQDALASHLEACTSCRQLASSFRRLVDTLESPALPDVPERLLRDGAAVGRHSVFERVRVFVAEMLEGWNNGDELVPAVRGAAAPAAPMLFGAGEYEIDIELAGRDLLGQVLHGADTCEAHPEESVCVLEGAGAPRSAALEPTGEFHFPGVEPGSYRLLIDLVRTQIVFEDLRLGDTGGPG